MHAYYHCVCTCTCTFVIGSGFCWQKILYMFVCTSTRVIGSVFCWQQMHITSVKHGNENSYCIVSHAFLCLFVLVLLCLTLRSVIFSWCSLLNRVLMALCTHLGLGLIMTPLSWRPSPVREVEFITSLTAQKRFVQLQLCLVLYGRFWSFPPAVLGFVLCCVVLCCVTNYMYICSVVSCYVVLCCVDVVFYLVFQGVWVDYTPIRLMHCLPYRFQGHLQTVLEACWVLWDKT